MTAHRKILIVIAGPTAVGKTEVAIQAARYFQTEIISADSRQIYKEMTIGTAKPSIEELNMVPHHFIGTKSIFDPYSAGTYEQEAITTISRLHETHRIVIVSGGTGLYLKAIQEGLDDFPDVPGVIREKWQQSYNRFGLEFLQEALKKMDPAYEQIVDRSNPRRLLRALTVCEASGQAYSNFLSGSPVERPFVAHCFSLTRDRHQLYDRINKRVDIMLRQGLLDEVRALFPHRHLNALQTVGYREFFDFIEGRCTYEEAVEKVKAHSRQYAKRQMTWYRNQHAYREWDADDGAGLIRFIEDL